MSTDSTPTSVGSLIAHAKWAGQQLEGVAAYEAGDHGDAWLVLSLAFGGLLALDLLVLPSRHQNLTHAVLATLFFVACGGMFNIYIYFRFGHDSAIFWSSAYLLEWMLSLDNLFAFHSIFTAYATPPELRHRPLTLGILGALCMRLLMLALGTSLLSWASYAHVVFGVFLIIAGVQTMVLDDDDEVDPSKVWIVKMAKRFLPFVDYYDKDGALFVKVAVDSKGEALVSGKDVKDYGAVENSLPPVKQKTAWRATILFMVVICVEAADVIFAVDSVAAVLAQVKNLFLAYSAVIFGMLGLRSSYFVLTSLALRFDLLQFGIGMMLIFLGVKLVCEKVFTIDPLVTLVILVSTLGICVTLSVIKDYRDAKSDDGPRATSATIAANGQQNIDHKVKSATAAN